MNNVNNVGNNSYFNNSNNSWNIQNVNNASYFNNVKDVHNVSDVNSVKKANITLFIILITKTIWNRAANVKCR